MTSDQIGGGIATLRSFGWPMVDIDGREALLMTQGICGVSLPQPLGERVRERLATVDSCGPIVGHHRPLPRYVVLAESDSFVAAAEFARRGAVLLPTSTRIPLPRTDNGDQSLYWVVAPSPTRRWLPNLSTVLWALLHQPVRC
ncbi:hypothetical protein IU449_00665 [Nocardia higoensis]|uniref:LysR substrate-binding domain-containing protein n=1 Tax=Nocardia higoensis TaxID=228599 RepID=A0ABS0D5I3_9NOCA|nr:hypothetical protein [Nocardia higoensis]MBF6353073.1 hypothetical protein [Nocardia higoensis]